MSNFTSLVSKYAHEVAHEYSVFRSQISLTHIWNVFFFAVQGESGLKTICFIYFRIFHWQIVFHAHFLAMFMSIIFFIPTFLILC